MVHDSNTLQDNHISRIARLRRGITATPATWLICILLALLSFILNMLYLGRASIWFDEAFSVELARQPLPVLWRTIFGPEPNMELYYLLLHFWLRLTGWSGFLPVEWVVRFPSVLCSALSTGLLFLLARRYLGTLVAAVAAVLYATNYLQLVYAQQTRAYALQLLLLMLSWFTLLLAMQKVSHEKRWWISYVLVTTLAIYTHLFSLFVIFAQFIALAGLLVLPTEWRLQIRSRMPAYLLSLVVVALASIPMFLESLHGSKTGWLFIPHLHELLSLFTIISGSNNRYLFVVGGSILMGILVMCLATWIHFTAARLRSAGQRRPVIQKAELLSQLWPFVWILLCWFVVPIVVSYLVSQGSLRLFSTRYLVVVVPPFCLLAVLGIVIWQWRVLQVLMICLLLGSALLVVPHYYPNAQIEEWNTAVHWLLARSQPDDGLVCYDNATTQGCQIAVEYYLHAYPDGTHFSEDSPGAFSWDKFSRDLPQTNPALAIDPIALATYAREHPRIFMITGRIATDADATQARKAEQWLDQHYRFDNQIVTRTVTIRLYRTK
ncbi:hypothetical protein KDW_25290 [Dictyobacter vulcani]|uniref:Glycosyltransferase RgtA/B/C/D-like domain-containing protein n=1 Tax=Dictyobacter vulcani TaxID=2607529 RepID=A0A5J4KPJ8_9CHLR|nr:glycosyltransferase family 39 protein [Dictyobacter vulcani]GER88367.1 hypothetical protein KDW_25290 [Dictyobacter vulcani]